MTEAADEQFYRAAMRRIYINLLWISGAGVMGTLLWRGWRDAVGFAAGAAVSAINFRWFHHLVSALGQASGPARTKGHMAWFLGFRYLIFGLAAYAIVRYFRIQPAALLAGLLVVVAAVLLEILYELFYART
ncbi:MAG: ATP synthase subunit I [Acidobacteriia bacterium]|nr:ATP synthase subunit I [Terriglobia bacterium]